MLNNVAAHYDVLIDINNDPVHDPEPLKAYMDLWDGQEFIDKMNLSKTTSALEIGVGTGRLAVRTAPLCGEFYGIDISPKTIERAKENLAACTNVSLVCDDFLAYSFARTFDVIYSSLTFMHIKEKQAALDKAAALLSDGGKFVLSIDKNQDKYIDIEINRIEIYPDTPDEMAASINKAGMNIVKQYETEFAHIFVCTKPSP